MGVKRRGVNTYLVIAYIARHLRLIQLMAELQNQMEQHPDDFAGLSEELEGAGFDATLFANRSTTNDSANTGGTTASEDGDVGAGKSKLWRWCFRCLFCLNEERCAVRLVEIRERFWAVMGRLKEMCFVCRNDSVAVLPGEGDEYVAASNKSSSSRESHKQDSGDKDSDPKMLKFSESGSEGRGQKEAGGVVRPSQRLTFAVGGASRSSSDERGGGFTMAHLKPDEEGKDSHLPDPPPDLGSHGQHQNLLDKFENDLHRGRKSTGGNNTALLKNFNRAQKRGVGEHGPDVGELIRSDPE